MTGYGGDDCTNELSSDLINISISRSENSMNFVSACLNVDPNKRPTTEELAKYSLFCHDNFNVWFLQDLQQKLQEEFISNPLLKTRKTVPSASKIKSAAEEILSKRNNEKTSVVIRTFNFRINHLLISSQLRIFVKFQFNELHCTNE